MKRVFVPFNISIVLYSRAYLMNDFIPILNYFKLDHRLNSMLYYMRRESGYINTLDWEAQKPSPYPEEAVEPPRCD